MRPEGLCLGSAAHFLLCALVLSGTVVLCYFLVDRPAALWARALDPDIVAAFRSVTVLGSAVPYLVGLAALYLLLRFSLRRPAAARRALFVFAAIVVSGATVNLIKPVVARWRPIAYVSEPSQYGFTFFEVGYRRNSFPSGHATTAWAVASALTLLYPRRRVLWIGGAVLVATSRVVVGAHFPGDVIAGAWFGVTVTLALGRTVWLRDALRRPTPEVTRNTS